MPTDTDPVPDYGNLWRFDSRTMVVLGAGLGIGRQTSHALAQLGATVVCADLELERAEAVASEVNGIAVAGDITDRSDVERIIGTAVDRTGHLDGLVDIVGMAAWSPLLEIDDAIYQGQLDICFKHAFLAMQVAGREMRRLGTRGSMAFVASVSGLSGAPNHAIYGAAKAGLMALVKSGAVELAEYGIRVNAVAPGNTATPRARATSTPDRAELQAQNIPLGRLGTPTDIASALVFFLSDLADQVTGQVLVVDGGVNAKFQYMPTRA